MREESHLDDMRSAIRGDFERLAERRGGQELMSLDDEAGEQDVTELMVERASEPEPTPELEPHRDAVSDPQPEPEVELEPELEQGAERERPGSWLDRLLGR